MTENFRWFTVSSELVNNQIDTMLDVTYWRILCLKLATHMPITCTKGKQGALSSEKPLECQ